jgi:uncharacterized cupredoxin-like copper-binding protein
MHPHPVVSHEQARVGPARSRVAAVLLAGAIALADIATALAPSALGFSGAAHAAEPQRHGADKPAAARRKPRDTPFGREGDPKKVTRTIRVETSDTMRYFPEHLTVKKGQTVRFNVRNAGALPHEMVLGTMDDLKKHAETMRRNADMPHDDANVAHVDPGQTGRIVWQFTRAGEFYYGCLVPGHFEAGMIGTIVVR